MRKKDPAKKQLILDRATEMIARDGAGALSTAHVARAVGIAQSNIYIYFKDRDALLAAVFDRAQATGASYIDNQKLTDETLPMTTRLLAYLHGLYQWSVHAPQDMLILEQIKQLPTAPTATHQTSVRTDAIFTLIHEAQAAGVCRPVPARLLVTAVFAVIRSNAALPDDSRITFDQLLPVMWGSIACTPIPTN